MKSLAQADWKVPRRILLMAVMELVGVVVVQAQHRKAWCWIALQQSAGKNQQHTISIIRIWHISVSNDPSIRCRLFHKWKWYSTIIVLWVDKGEHKWQCPNDAKLGNYLTLNIPKTLSGFGGGISVGMDEVTSQFWSNPWAPNAIKQCQ
jgi:hypothetical protein